MAPMVKFVLALLRAASHAALFLEAQRLALRFARPTSVAHLAALEHSLLATVHTPVSHLFVPTPLPIHALVAAPSSPPAQPTNNDNNVNKQPPPPPPPPPPPIVLLHGHSMSAAFFFRNFDDLVALGYRVYAIDLLGWGRSARPRFHGSTPDDTLDWYLASLHACFDALHLTTFTLLGHSLGAYLAFEYAKRFPHRVRKLIMISPAAIARPIPFVRACYFALPPQSIVRRGGLLGFLLFMLYYPRSDCYVRDRLRDFTYHLAAQGPPSGEVAIIPIIQFHGPIAASVTRPLIEALDPLPVPVQLVCGETDASINVQDVHLLFREMKRKGFNVRLSVVQGTDHCPHLEAPDAFFDAISDFARPKSNFVESPRYCPTSEQQPQPQPPSSKQAL